MDKQAIKEICLKHGYKLKPQADGSQDLNAYVYDAFGEVLSCVRHGQQMANLAKATMLSDALHLIQSGVRYNHEKDLECGLELLRSTRDELCAVPNYHDDVEIVGTKQVEFAIIGLPNLSAANKCEPNKCCSKYPECKHNKSNLTRNDPINPKHYTSHPSGVEAIEITRHMGFSLGNAMKYLWRNGLKDGQPAVQDLEKAVWYIQDEIKRLKSATDKKNL